MSGGYCGYIGELSAKHQVLIPLHLSPRDWREKCEDLEFSDCTQILINCTTRIATNSQVVPLLKCIEREEGELPWREGGCIVYNLAEKYQGCPEEKHSKGWGGDQRQLLFRVGPDHSEDVMLQMSRRPCKEGHSPPLACGAYCHPVIRHLHRALLPVIPAPYTSCF